MTRTLFALAVAFSWVASAAAPALSGLYVVGDLGLVDFSTSSDGVVSGRVRTATKCAFPSDTKVVSGTFEDDVFIGTVTLCQQGPKCPPDQAYPMLAVHQGNSLSATVRLAPGCSSPALASRALRVTPASADQKRGGDSRIDRDARARAAQHIIDGNRMLQDQKTAPAQDHFKQAMEADPTSWEARMGFGITEVKLDRAQESLPLFDDALRVAAEQRAKPEDISQIHYNRACALTALGDRAGAVSSLREAVQLGGAQMYLDALLSDPDLQSLRQDKDFKRLAAETQVQAKKRGR